MALEQTIKGQLQQYLAMLENDIVFTAALDAQTDSRKVREFLEEISAMSPKISIKEQSAPRTPSFTIEQPNQASGIWFAGIPLGHEFTSFVLALLQVGGRAPKITEELRQRIEAIEQPLAFETYVSLTCHNCPDVVQALNILSVLNPQISHTMIEGGMFQAEVTEKDILAVPTVWLNGKEFGSGRMTIEAIVDQVAPATAHDLPNQAEPYDVLVIGGGPAGASAAIYAARKGIRTGMVVETFGGQVLETLGIENLIGTPYTEGPKLMTQVEAHVQEYPVDILRNQRATALRRKELVEVELASGATLSAKTAIVTTGARWRAIGVPGEKEFKNKGVAYCPHCDGPLFKGKKVAVIGGGNSGIEAAIDLAGMVEEVTVIEFLPELKADQVLQKRLATLPNVTVVCNAATDEIYGEKTVQGLRYQDRATKEVTDISVEGVFILIGLMPNTEWLPETVTQNSRGEIEVAADGATALEGVFAAGDCTDSRYKQIIISMGSGATAALGAFDYLIRH